MGLHVHPGVFEALPGLRIAVIVAEGLGRAGDPEAIARFWSEAWDGAAAAGEYGNAQSHPRIAPWRESFRALGVSGKRFPTSIEALLRRAMKGGEPFRIHPLVDFYNAISLQHVLPAGGYDLAEIAGDLEVRLTGEGDTFQALDDEDPETVPAGELAYTCGSEVLTRHLVWRQSERALIRETTRDAVFVSEAVAEIPDQAVDAVAADLCDGLRRWFGSSPATHRLDAERPALSW
ncbi:MAG: B3/4 domain-containing protein [Thermoanaerobaculia bacterium]